MKAIELLKNQESLLVVDAIQNKKVKAVANTLNDLIAEMNQQISNFENFNESQKSGEQGNKIIVAKSLCKFFEGNKFLKVEMAVDALRNEEKTVMNTYYATKNKLLDTIRAIMKESNKEAIVSAFDLFEGDFVKCPEGHEIIILGGRNLNVLDTFLQELDMELIIDGAFESIEGQEVDYNTSIIDRNIELCNRKNNELYGSKQGKMDKISAIIDKLREVGEKAVAFFTYKDALEDIGCTPKGIKDYETDLEKNYIPLKKTLQKEFKIELEDINNVVADEDCYKEVDMEQPIEPQLEALTSTLEETSSSLEDFQTPSTFNSIESNEISSAFKTTNDDFAFSSEPDIQSVPLETTTSSVFESPINSDSFSQGETETFSTFETTTITDSQTNSFDTVENTFSSPFESSSTTSQTSTTAYESFNTQFEEEPVSNNNFESNSFPIPDINQIEEEINNNTPPRSPLESFFNPNNNNSSDPFDN